MLLSSHFFLQSSNAPAAEPARPSRPPIETGPPIVNHAPSATVSRAPDNPLLSTTRDNESMCSTESRRGKKKTSGDTAHFAYVEGFNQRLDRWQDSYEKKMNQKDDMFDIWGKGMAIKLREAPRKKAMEFMVEMDNAALGLYDE